MTNPTEHRILLFPAFTKRDDLIDELARSVWYFEPVLETTIKLYIMVRDLTVTTADVQAMLQDFGTVIPKFFAPQIVDRAKQWVDRVEVHVDKDHHLEKTWSAPGTNIVLCWDSRTDERYAQLMDIGDRCGVIYAFGSVKTNIREAANRPRIAYEMLTPERKADIGERAPKVLRQLREELAGREAYVYGSGPSVSQLIDADFDFGNGFHIVCNSLVKNDELMNIIKPKIVVCADPVFHAGPSEYAAEFRRTLNRFLDRHDAYVVTLVDYVATLCVDLDPKHWDRVIGVSLSNDIQTNLDLADNQLVAPTENILTLLMFPLAATLSDNVSILGCDGRSFVQDSYFWAHDKKSQFSNLMDDTKVVHPAFFKRNFNDYYLAHCMVLERFFTAAEEQGKRVRLITPSYLPPLAKRYEAVI